MTYSAMTQLFVYEPEARRIELLVRILYWIAIGIVGWVYGVIALLCLIVQWFYILIMGRRSQGLSDFAKGYLEYMVHRMPYLYLMTDRRPAVFPDKVAVFEEMEKSGGE